MADSITGVHRILPSYPVKPVQPADKDRDAERQQRRPTKDETPADSNDDNESGDKPTIDEYV